MNVWAVVVTFRRRELLDRALDALEGQTRPPDRVLVVDNASQDGTAELVRERHPDAELLVLPENVGGAGGFHAGMERAHVGGADWTWLLDDDTIAAPTALAELLRAADHRDPLGRRPVLLSSRTEWIDGRLHPMNAQGFERSRLGLVVDGARHGLMPLRTATFVSLLVARRAVDEHGLPLRRYFLWSDDIEYTARILRHEAGFAVPSSIVVHETTAAHTAISAAGDRFYFHVRNSLYMLRGQAWARREKPSLLFGLLVSLLQYLQHNRFAPRSFAPILRGLRDGLRPGVPTARRP